MLVKTTWLLNRCTTFSSSGEKNNFVLVSGSVTNRCYCPPTLIPAVSCRNNRGEIYVSWSKRLNLRASLCVSMFLCVASLKKKEGAERETQEDRNNLSISQKKGKAFSFVFGVKGTKCSRNSS